MKFYHYTNIENLKEIFHGDRYRKRGLWPGRPVVPPLCSHGLPDAATTHAIFGLLAPTDSKWCTNTFYQDVPLLESVMRDIGTDITLLEITVVPSDRVYVADYGPHLRPDYLGMRMEDKKVLKQVKMDYWKSKISLASYLQQGLSYTVPEVWCFNKITPRRIQVVNTEYHYTLVNKIRTKGGFKPIEVLRRYKPAPVEPLAYPA
jgi:hypothetical protein